MPASISPKSPLRHTPADWLAALPHLKRKGREHVGPCPVCGGHDRFRINSRGAFCRRGCAYPDLLRVVFGNTSGHGGSHWFDRTQAHLLPHKPGPKPDLDETRARLVADLWAACTDASGTPGHAYLTARYVWPPAGEGLPDLPNTSGWLDVSLVQSWRRRGWPGLPDGAAGALVFTYRRPGTSAVCAVSLEALDAEGCRPAHRWRRTFGERAGAVFSVPGRGVDMALCEGEVDALALALTGAYGEARATGGTGGMTLAACADSKGRHVVIVPDGDGAGYRTAMALGDDLDRSGIPNGLLTLADQDPAAAIGSWLRDWIEERIGLGMMDDEAWRSAFEASTFRRIFSTHGDSG